MEPDWKKNAEMCGLVLDNNAVRALNESGISDCSNVSTIHLKHRIYTALPTTSASTYDERKSMAFNLAVVAKYGSPTFPSWLICFGLTPFKLQCRLPDHGVLSTSEVKQYCPNIPDIAYTGEFVHWSWRFHIHLQLPGDSWLQWDREISLRSTSAKTVLCTNHTHWIGWESVYMCWECLHSSQQRCNH